MNIITFGDPYVGQILYFNIKPPCICISWWRTKIKWCLLIENLSTELQSELFKLRITHCSWKGKTIPGYERSLDTFAYSLIINHFLDTWLHASYVMHCNQYITYPKIIITKEYFRQVFIRAHDRWCFMKNCILHFISSITLYENERGRWQRKKRLKLKA